MRIIIVTQEDPFYLPIFFRRFYSLAAEAENAAWLQIVGVVIQKPLGNRSTLALAKRMLGLYGPFRFLMKGLAYTAGKISERLREKGIVRHAGGVRGMTAAAGIPAACITDVNSRAFARYARQQEVDLIVSVAASQIFKADILELPPLGCINLHNAPLPHYRGMLPNFWQLYHGESSSVLTIHEMTPRLDKGRILLQDKTPIRPGESLESLIRRTKYRNAEALLGALRQLETGTAVFTDPPPGNGSYFSFPTRADVKEFRRRGHKVV